MGMIAGADPDRLHRTVKLEIDEGRAATVEEAARIASRYVLQLHVGREVVGRPGRQAALLTVINTARRAFLGGVRVQLAEDPVLDVRWAEGMRLSEAVAAYGGTVAELGDEHPTIALGDLDRTPAGRLVLYPTWQGWTGGAVDTDPARLDENNDQLALSGLLAGALAVSECFQHVRGDVVAGRREVGVSLWRPDLDWRDPEAVGPACPFLPSRLWLLGLGHLGQAYCWALGFLPYADPKDVWLMLQDFDRVIEANEATALLAGAGDRGKRKARVVARRMEDLGFKTSVTERPFDAATRRRGDEPGLALGGFDRREPRRELGGARFDFIVDAGLGAGPDHYLDMLIHSFPSGLTPAEAWPLSDRSRPDRGVGSLERPAYQDLEHRLTTEGLTEEEARCGVLEVSGQSVGAAFVGAVTASLVLAEVLRLLRDGPRYEVIGLSLRSPRYRDAVMNSNPGPPLNPGFVPTA
jgi:hypothetical protein